MNERMMMNARKAYENNLKRFGVTTASIRKSKKITLAMLDKARAILAEQVGELGGRKRGKKDRSALS
jgi:hypothetical protein